MLFSLIYAFICTVYTSVYIFFHINMELQYKIESSAVFEAWLHILLENMSLPDLPLNMNLIEYPLYLCCAHPLMSSRGWRQDSCSARGGARLYWTVWSDMLSKVIYRVSQF